MHDVRISYTPIASATPEAELTTLAAVYKLILDGKKGTRPGAPDDGTKSKEDSADERIIQQSA